MRAAWHGDTLVGRAVRRAAGRWTAGSGWCAAATPGVVEHDYQVWKMPASDSQYAVTEDTSCSCATRDGARLATYIAQPVGPGPFGVVLQRTPYRRDSPRAPACGGRRAGTSSWRTACAGARSPAATSRTSATTRTDIHDGYDAVEWAARLPHANGKVGMIGHSDEGRLVWFAAVSNPPHLAAIAPTAATADPWMHRPVRRDGVRAHQRGLGVPDARGAPWTRTPPTWTSERRSRICRWPRCRSGWAAATCRCGTAGSRIPRSTRTGVSTRSPPTSTR